VRLGILWLVAVLVLAAIAAYLYYEQRQEEAPPETVVRLRPYMPPEPGPEQAPPQPPPEPQYPVTPEPAPAEEPAAEEPPAEPPLPPLDESDPAVREAVSEVMGPEPAGRFLVPDHLVRRIVATVDNMTRDRVSMKVRAVPAIKGSFRVRGPEEELVIDEANFERYRPFVDAVAAIDPARAAAVYRRLYPLFQQAYEELGYPSGYFNDRLVAIIDDLLAAPEVAGPIRLEHPGVLYTFADPDLERRSPGQKMLIRMGPENAAVLKEKLREIRREIVKNKRPD
jgi:hypothetical protein